MLATVIGALGILANCIIYQQKSGKGLLLCKLISDVLWLLHYLLLGAYSAAAVALIGGFREFVFYKENKKPKKNIFFFYLFIGITVTSAILTWKSAASLLPALASVISIVSFWRALPALSRILAYPVSLLMLTYDLTCGSYVGIVNEVLTVAATTFAIICAVKNKRKAEKL